MEIANVYSDMGIGIIEFLALLIFFIKTKKYSAFNCSYYYYLIAAPCYVFLYLVKIILFPKSNIDPTQIDSSGTENPVLPLDRKSQILEVLQMVLVSPILILPTLIELMCGSLSTLAKYTLIKNPSLDDIYIIHSIPALLGIALLCLKNFKETKDCLKELKETNGILLNNGLGDLYSHYITVAIMFDVSIGVALNTLMLMCGSFIGLNICNYLIHIIYL